jgi:hypothetical protein
MTANEMADKIELRVNKVDSLAGFGYEDIELSSFLNTAQIYYLNEFIDRNNNRQQKGLEETEARSWGLAPLITPITLAQSGNQTGSFTNGIYYTLPTDFYAFLTETPISNKKDCKDVAFIEPDVEVVSHDEYQRLIRNYYKKPYIGNTQGVVWRMADSGQRVQLITDGTFTITSYKAKYLKSIPSIVVDRAVPANQVNCILGTNTTGLNPVHETIVEIAINLIDRSVGEQRTPGLGLEQIH